MPTILVFCSLSFSAQKFAGRLTWATQWLFNKVGRAMIRPIYAQVSSGSGTVSARLLSALNWWAEVLQQGVTEVRSWRLSRSNICRLYVDAASTPACCAAVLFIDGRKLYTSWEPSVVQMRQFNKRRDNHYDTRDSWYLWRFEHFPRYLDKSQNCNFL